MLVLFLWGLFFFQDISFAIDEWVKNILWEVADNKAWTMWVAATSVGWIRDFMIIIWKKIILPIIAVIWLLIAFLWFHKIMFSDKEDERKKGINFFTWGTIWVVLMVSAWFITDSLVGNHWVSWIIWSWTDFDAATIASNLYNDIFRKFFILVMYLVIVILFVIVVINIIKLISSPDKEDIAKHAQTSLIWSTIWIIIILFSKNIIEMFYKKVAEGTKNIWNQAPILESKDIWWLYTVLNYFLWFVAFIITIFIIYQAFLLLTKPDDEQTYKSLKKYFIYSIFWVFLIWWVYIIANFFIIK